MSVLVYQDYVFNNVKLYRRLSDYFGAEQVSFCDADDIQNRQLNSDVRLFIMPGGADLYFCEKLHGQAAAFIRSWVETGGTYLGICAGAYFGCSTVEWAKDTSQEICGPRELAFFEGIAVGPVYDFIEEKNIEKSWQAAPSLSFSDRQLSIETPVFYEGGPVFLPNDSYNDFTILARYAELTGDNAAIVECTVGKGKAILCSPHIEHSAETLSKRLYQNNNPSYEWEAQVAGNLARTMTTNQKIFEHILNRCSGEHND